MDVPMELSRILITELGDQQIIFLREVNGERTFPIRIGISEALAIDRRLKGKKTPRPMTHDLLAGVIQAMGGRIEKIVINDIRKVLPDDASQTFIATLHIRRGGQVIRVDSRPSDAIALGAAFETPIFVAEHVLNSVLNEPSSKADRIEMLRRRMEVLSEKIDELGSHLADQSFLSSAPDAMVQEAQRQLEMMKTEYEAIDRVLKKLG